MIVHFKKDVDSIIVNKFVAQYGAFHFKKKDYVVAITSSSLKEFDLSYDDFISDTFVFNDDIQLASKKYLTKKRSVKLGDIEFGGDSKNIIMMAGPCSVESKEQIEESSLMLKSLNLKILRAGCYKPRTSPYSFQGLGLEGLKLLDKMRSKHDLKIITEVRDSSHIEDIIEYSDIIQIGAKAMYDQGILKRCSKINKPILLKRGFGTTLQEFVQAAEFILSGGNENVILCERGIRTFETKTRFTLDLCGVAYLKEHTNLPVVLDPTHAMGHAYGIPDLTRACVAMGIDGLLIETHINPKVAKSDASQQLDHEEFKKMFNSLHPIAKAIGKEII